MARFDLQIARPGYNLAQLLAIASLLVSSALSGARAAADSQAVVDPAAAGFALHWANITIDHFNFVPKGPDFPLRVYVMDKYWDRRTGPILFCETQPFESRATWAARA